MKTTSALCKNTKVPGGNMTDAGSDTLQTIIGNGGGAIGKNGSAESKKPSFVHCAYSPIADGCKYQ